MPSWSLDEFSLAQTKSRKVSPESWPHSNDVPRVTNRLWATSWSRSKQVSRYTFLHENISRKLSAAFLFLSFKPLSKHTWRAAWRCCFPAGKRILWQGNLGPCNKDRRYFPPRRSPDRDDLVNSRDGNVDDSPTHNHRRCWTPNANFWSFNQI